MAKVRSQDSCQLSAVSCQLFEEAKKYIAGGVNSPVRSFKAVGGEPIFIKSGKESKICSEDGREFIDYCMGWGALILGHAHKKVVEELKKAVDKGVNFGTPTMGETGLAKIIVEAMPSIEKVRLTNSGTEAVMGAVRLARAFTKKNKVVKFEGSYHGHADYLLDCKGVPESFKDELIVLPYNGVKSVEDTTAEHQKNIAAIIVEPVAANIGLVLPKGEFLRSLRKISDKYNVVLIFDEVITGFRLSFGGAQENFKIKPDLTCLGKIIGGGLPVGAFGGRRDIMELLSPEGNVYQAGTFSGNPLTVSAGIATLNILKETMPYKTLENKTKFLCSEIVSKAKTHNIGLKVNYAASLFSIFFTDTEVNDYQSAKDTDINRFKKFYHLLLKEGVYLSPSYFETDFLSTAHTDQDIEKTLTAVDKAFKNFRGC